MENAISYLKVMPETKAEIEMFVSKVLAEIQVREALPLLARLTAIEKTIELIKDGIKDAILEEADLEGAKSFTLNGVKYERKGRTTYYFHHAAKWNDLKAQIKSLEDMMKAAREPFVDAETGEIIDPARSSYKEYIAVTLK